MATILPCDMCEAEQADIMVTNLGNGDTFTVGANCLPQFGQTLIGELASPEGLPPIGEDGTGWPGNVDTEGLPKIPGVDMAAMMEEARLEALAELEAEALAAGGQSPVEGSEAVDGADTPPDGPEAVSEAVSEPETAV